MQFQPFTFIPLYAEIVTTGGSYFVSVDSTEERDEWIESIRKASVSQYLYYCAVFLDDSA